ncbi:MAG: hypothetical protein COA90_09020 [Gammaproteobacteria bacterium]|nr:MAG: hypothetical protein COA90_09020 [Gammaproteobacteria bacterium]
MNKAYKVIWNISPQSWIISGQFSKSKGKIKSNSPSTHTLMRKLSAALLIAGISAVPIQVLAATINWTGTTGDWLTASHWDISSPTPSDDAYIDNAGTAQVTSAGAVALDLFIGSTNTNTSSLSISNGGTVNNVNSIVGRGSGSTGTVTVEGASSTWTNTGYLRIGDSGNGTLTISNGGAVSNTNATIGRNSKSISSATVEGLGSIWTSTGQLRVGDNGSASDNGSGSLTIRHGGTVNYNLGYIGTQSYSTGTVTVEDAGSTLTTTSSNLSVGLNGTGHLTISNAGAVTNKVGLIAHNLNSTGTVIVEGSGSTWTNTGLHIGEYGTGYLTIRNGGAVTNNDGIIGRRLNSTGTVIVEGASSTWTNNTFLHVGDLGTGSLTISNGGAVSNTSAIIGLGSVSTGTVIVEGAGSTWINNTFLRVGDLGTGNLTISNGGAVTVVSGTGTTTIASQSGSTSTLSIGAASDETAVAAGTLNTGTLEFGLGTGSLVFNHTDTVYDFSADITGVGAIKLLSGSTRFTGDLTGYNAGSLTVDGGTLAIHSGDTLLLGADYTQTANGVLSIGVANDTTFGKLLVAGTVTLASNAKINIDVTDANSTTTSMANVITAGTLVSDGSFSVTDNSTLFDFSAVKDGDTVDLILTAATSGAAAATDTSTPAASGAAKLVDDLSQAFASNGSTGNVEMDGVITQLGALTTQKALAGAVETTLPSISGGTAQMTNTTANAVTGIVSSRQGSLRGQSSGDGFITDRHIWLKPFGGRTEQDTRQRVTGYDVNSYGLAVGIDGDISSSWNVGAALAYINSDVKSNLAAGTHNVDMDSYIAKVYASKTLDEATALNLQAGVGMSNYDSHRRLFTGDVASADYDSWNVQLSAEVERSFQVSTKTTVTPYLHADYSYVNVDSYRESGAGALNLNVDDDSADSLVIGVGAKASQTVSDSLSIMVNAGVGYDVMTDRSSLTSSFAGGGAQFTTEGIEPDEVVYNAGVGARYSLSNGTEISANYAIDARQDYTDQSLSANIRMMF